jgi:hypothetical protein
VPGRQPLRSWLGFRVAEELATVRRRPMLPAYLAERIIVRESLRTDPDGALFTLRNMTRPAVLTAIEDLRLDGRALEAARVLVQTESGRVPLSRRVDLPFGRDLVLLVELSDPLEPGDHELEIDMTLPGVASGRVQVSGRVQPDQWSPRHGSQ